MERGLRSGKAILYYIQAAIARGLRGRPRFKARTVHVAFVVDEVATE